MDEFPGELSTLEQCEPDYKTLPGWDEPTKGVQRVEDLPANARRYLESLEELCDVPVEMVSTGPGRDAIIVDMGRGKALLDSWFPVLTTEKVQPEN
jgi:adenylosuccinate synthase